MESFTRYAILLVIFSALSLQLSSAQSCDQKTTVTIPNVGSLGDCLKQPIDKALVNDFARLLDKNGLNVDDFVALVNEEEPGALDLTSLTCSDGNDGDNLNKALFAVAKLVSCLNLQFVVGPLGLIATSASLAGILATLLKNLLPSVKFP